MRTESNRHKEAREFIAKIYNGINRDHENRKIGGYFPDVQTIDKDIEIENYSKNHHIAGKVKRWDKSRKKILIITMDKKMEKLFDEVYILLNDNTLMGKEIQKLKEEVKV